MSKKRSLRISALFFSLLMLLTACGQKPAADAARPRRTVPFSQMVYTRPDTPAMVASLEEIAVKMQNAESFDKLKELEAEAEAISEEFYTMSRLASLKRYLDTKDTALEEEARYCEEQEAVFSNASNEVIRAIVYSKFAEDYRKEVGDYYFQDMQNVLMLNSKEVEPMKQERAQLNLDYNQKLGDIVLVEDGVEYTVDDILQGDSYERMLQMYIELYRQNAQEFTDIYTRMIELDRETAALLGFNSVAEMYYLSYARDYTPQQALEYCDDSKELFAPLYNYLRGYRWDVGAADFNTDVKAMPDALKNVNGELVDAWKFMIDNELFDYEARPEKQSGIAFQTNLYSYDAPFCYGYWEDDFRSTTTVMHEFGHFYDSWLRYDTDTVFNLDIAETYSQGLELLMQKQFDKFTKVPQDEEMAHMVGFAGVLTYQAVLEEFQQRLYNLDSFDAETVARLYADVQLEYGMEPLVDEKGCDYTWYQVTHLFDAPFYTISYCTSAAAALQIWEKSQDDWKAGVDVYLKLIHADQNQPFTKLVEGVGLANPLDRATLEAISESLFAVYDLTPESLPDAA